MTLQLSQSAICNTDYRVVDVHNKQVVVDISIHKVFSEIPKKSCGDEVLKNVLGGPGIVRASAQDHIGSFSESVRHIPGIVEYFEEAARLQD